MPFKRKTPTSASSEPEPGPGPVPEPEPEPLLNDNTIQSHKDLMLKALQGRAQKEAETRLNRIHEMELQIKNQQMRQPEVPLKDDNGMTWEDYHDLFWQVKRGLKFKDDPFGLNAHLAHLLKEDQLISWQSEERR